MAEYIEKDAFIRSIEGNPFTTESVKSYIRVSVKKFPAANVAEVVRCRECKHRIVNENYGKRGYMKLKAMCDLDTNDCFQLGRCAEDDDWFCADGERKDGADND